MGVVKFLEFRTRFCESGHFKWPANAALETTERNFFDNYNRILSSLNIPDCMAFAGLSVMGLWFQAQLDVDKTIKSGEYVSAEERHQRIGERNEELKKQGIPQSREEHWGNLAKVLVTGAESPDLNLDASVLHKGLEAIMLGAVTAAYTAFEVVAADTWKACLNARPRLGFVALNVEPSEDDNEEEVARKYRARIQVPVWMLRDPNFDLKSHMGTLLASMKKWDFANRRETWDAYIKVFPELKAQIDAIFNDENLRWLAAIRNVVVHNACVADAEFVKLVKRNPILNSVPEGERITLDGDLLGPIAAAGFEQGKALVAFVDEWLAKFDA